MESFSPCMENGLVSVAGTSGFPGVDVWLVRRLDSVGEVNFINVTFFFLEAEGVIYSLLDDIFDRMLSTRVSMSYCRRQCEYGVTTQGCLDGNGTDDTRFTEWGQGCRQGAASG